MPTANLSVGFRFALRAALIAVLSALAGLWAVWQAPELDRYSRDWLMRLRGVRPAPEDIVIVAIDEKSLQRFGRFPWPRSVLANVIDAVSRTQPKSIAVDVLFADPGSPLNDSALRQAIARAGNVVLAAQLTSESGVGAPSEWLLPVPELAGAAASLGSAAVLAEADGVAREIPIAQADDNGRALRAMAIETIRIGEGIAERSIRTEKGAVLLGSHRILTNSSETRQTIRVRSGSTGPRVLENRRMEIDYIGPPGSFISHTFSVADVLDGHVPASSLHARYVLIGATAENLGDRLATPFVHFSSGDAENGAFMPGVEILANAVATISQNRFYSNLSEGASFLLAVFVAAAVFLSLTSVRGGWLALKQFLVLGGFLALVTGCSDIAFADWRIYPPLPSAIIAVAVAGLLTLIDMAFRTSLRMDRIVAAIRASSARFVFPRAIEVNTDTIAQLAGASAVAIVLDEKEGRRRLLGVPGLIRFRSCRGGLEEAVQRLQPPGGTTETIPFEDRNGKQGTVVLAFSEGRPPNLRIENRRLYAALAASLVTLDSAQPLSSRSALPSSGEAKAAALESLNRGILNGAQFIESSLESAADGLFVTLADGTITMVNQRSAAIFETTADALLGRNLFDLLRQRISFVEQADWEQVLCRLVLDRQTIEREGAVGGGRILHYLLHIAPVVQREEGIVTGLVASLTDITRQHELQQTKNDVIALVSHEMKTPLTAIQGMSELLSHYEMDAARRKDLSVAIHDEAKRLTRMVDDYLDITRLEAGQTVVRKAQVRLEPLIERVLLLLSDAIVQHDASILTVFDPALPGVLIDADLFSRAISNLVANALRYSPPGTNITIYTRAAEGFFEVSVEDEGYGIPEQELDRIWNKFYRVFRPNNVETNGTGLGLSMVREIAALHGGTVHVRSTLGRGSLFTIRVPFSPG